MSKWNNYRSIKPTSAGDYLVEIETKEQFQAYWSPMWNCFKVEQRLLWGVIRWKELSK